LTTTGGISRWFFDEGVVGRPRSITAGPDGALWFITGSASGQIGRITTAGALTTFPIPNSFVNMNGLDALTPGPDDALWFTGNNSDSIGRVTTSGAVQIFVVPGVNRPGDIVAGPDGAVWFTQATTLGRITIGTIGYADAVVGRGFEFDGTNDVSVGSWLSGLTGELTVEAWIKLGQNRDIIWMTDDESTRRPEELAVPAPVVWDGAFHHVAATWSRSEFAIYVDGTQVASRPSQGGTLNPAYDTPIRLGSTGGLRATFGFLGVIDEPTIHSRALTPSEIGTIHAVGSIGKCP
jgi:hypothetical protein